MSDYEILNTAIKEGDIAKSHCRTLITLNEKDTKVIHAQEKEIERLTKMQDPNIPKMYAELAAKARANMGMKDIEEYMSKIKKN